MVPLERTKICVCVRRVSEGEWERTCLLRPSFNIERVCVCVCVRVCAKALFLSSNSLRPIFSMQHIMAKETPKISKKATYKLNLFAKFKQFCFSLQTKQSSAALLGMQLSTWAFSELVFHSGKSWCFLSRLFSRTQKSFNLFSSLQSALRKSGKKERALARTISNLNVVPVKISFVESCAPIFRNRIAALTLPWKFFAKTKTKKKKKNWCNNSKAKNKQSQCSNAHCVNECSVRQSRSINHENFVRWNTKLKRCFSSVASFNLPKWFDNRLIQIVLLPRFKRKTRKKKYFVFIFFVRMNER